MQLPFCRFEVPATVLFAGPGEESDATKFIYLPDGRRIKLTIGAPESNKLGVAWAV